MPQGATKVSGNYYCLFCTKECNLDLETVCEVSGNYIIYFVLKNVIQIQRQLVILRTYGHNLRSQLQALKM